MKALRLFSAPFDDVMDGLDRCLDSGYRGLAWIGVGLVVGWWIYVPIHELLHALACLAAGGTVSKLEIDPLYGGALLAQVFPFVEAGGDYAGRLSGFDTGGNDLVYFVTVFGPYVLTLFPGVWALLHAGEKGSSFIWGFSLPFALAPFLSLTGDALEIGGILVTQVPPWLGAEVLRSDDLFRLVPELQKMSDAPWVGAVLAFVVGVVWAFVTYGAGRLLPGLLDRWMSSR